MVDLQQVQAELSCARQARLAAETAEHEIEALYVRWAELEQKAG